MARYHNLKSGNTQAMMFGMYDPGGAPPAPYNY
jgi:hypothetical protein